jgi:polar amino acid transport system substrate-binding protein
VTDLVLSLTDGFGADGVILGVVTTSSAPLNHAFNLCRQKGVVVGLGAFGTTFDRDAMVWNDVTLVMQLAYGPGRYDHVYEEGNVDYPIGYVRWTENRNAQHFLRLVGEGKVQPLAIEPERFAFADAPAAYERLKAPDRPATLLFEYPG